jgi:hypothetical protein
VVRTFTLDEANALVPTLIRAFGRTIQLLRLLEGSRRRMADAGVAVARGGVLDLPDDAAVAGRPFLVEELELARLVAGLVRDEVRALERRGLVVRDVQRGVVGVPSVVDGMREVLLLWELGQREIVAFCELSSSERQPLEGHRFFRSRQLRAPSE